MMPLTMSNSTMSEVAGWLGSVQGFIEQVKDNTQRKKNRKFQGLGRPTGLATKSSERLCSSLSRSCHRLCTTTGLGTDPNLPRKPSPPQKAEPVSLAASTELPGHGSNKEAARTETNLLTHRSVTSMPRKKLRKQRISIRRESSLLSEAGPPLLGFISDRSASLLCSVVVVVSILGLVLCVS